MLNKKAQFDVARKTIYWMLAGIMITVVVFAFAMIIGSYKGSLTNVPANLRSELISLRFANVPECFAYQDNASNVVFPGIIDLKKFNEATLKECYSTEGTGGIKVFNFRLKIQQQGTEILTDKYYNLDQADLTIYKEVLVKNGNNLEKDQLAIYVQERIGEQ